MMNLSHLSDVLHWRATLLFGVDFLLFSSETGGTETQYGMTRSQRSSRDMVGIPRYMELGPAEISLA